MHSSPRALVDLAFIACCNGTVECHGLPHRLTAANIGHVFAPGTTDEAAKISVQGCAGL